MKPSKRTTHSGFAKFLDVDARDRFVRSTLEGKAGLIQKAYLPASRPTIVFENLTTGQRDSIISALGESGRWFDDVQFKSTS